MKTIKIHVPDGADILELLELQQNALKKYWRGIENDGETWSQIFDIIICDPDGWKKDNKSFDDMISIEEFIERMIFSTCMYYPIAEDRR